ncbi:MAG: Rieske (2Fe-2S) protein [Candidatus Zixiibacteriota bacterium]
MTAKFRKIATLNDVPPGTMKSFEFRHHRFVLCNTGAGVFAVADECSHDSAPISEGELRGQEIVCPRHGARFNVKDGSVKAPPALVPIDIYAVKIDGEDIYVRLD